MKTITKAIPKTEARTFKPCNELLYHCGRVVAVCCVEHGTEHSHNDCEAFEAVKRGTAVAKRVETPWGISDSVHFIAPGIVSYSTPSHGGIHLSDERMADIPDRLRGLNKYGGGSWFEEDCEWSIVVLAFPDCFPPGDSVLAMQTAKILYPTAFNS